MGVYEEHKTMADLTEREQAFVDALPESADEIAEQLGVSPSTVWDYKAGAVDKGVPVEYDATNGHYYIDGDYEPNAEDGSEDTGEFMFGEDRAEGLPDLSDTPVAPEDPDPSGLTNRERVIVSELQTATTVDELADRLDERESIVTEHLRDLRKSGWRVYIDETAGHVAIEGDQALRSSEHKGTRTRKANQWWELSHNALVREFRDLPTPDAELEATSGNEDWLVHMTDLHAGDLVRDDDGTVLYSTEDIPPIIDYITEQGIALADKHGSDFDTAHLLWGGDFVTNEGIYEGQFEDLDAWLDEQHETLIDPLVRQLKAFGERFDSVQVVCQVGNHGQHRASGTSKQSNADLILYKSIRNIVAQIQKYSDILDNVRFVIGEARPYKNFDLRGGKLTGHMRHGQDRRPQAETSARDKEWTKTLLDHEFDVAMMGHYHISGRIPWDGPPIVVSPSPKPAGEFVESIGGRLPTDQQGVATAFGMSDDGITGVWPVDTRRYDGP